MQRSKSTLVAVLVALASMTVVGPLAAQAPPQQLGRLGTFRELDRVGEIHLDGQLSLRDAIGVPAAVKLLQSDDPADRLRGIARLGSLGDEKAIDALVTQLEQGIAASGSSSAKLRLEAVRALAPHVAKDNVRQYLAREATDASTSEGRGGFTPLGAMVRSSAAMALGKGGDKKAVSALAAAIFQSGVVEEAATRALRAWPPASIEPFLDAKKRLAPKAALILASIGDLRAAPRLRAMLAEKDVAAQVDAAVALARLGDDAPLVIAREWLKKSEPRIRRAAAEVLVHLGAPEAPGAVAALLASDATRDDGLRLALIAPSPALAAPLAAALPSFPAGARERVIAAIGRSGGAGAIQALTALLAGPQLAVAATHALATTPGDGAREVIERGLAKETGEARRRLLRAGIVRAIALGDPPRGLRAALEPMLGATDAADRSVAALGLAATGASSLRSLVDRACATGATGACDAAILGAAARGALARDPGALAALRPLLTSRTATRAGDHEDPIVIAAGAALLGLPDGGDLPTSTLAAWAEGGGALAPLAARALPSRDDEALRGRLKRLLEGSDPVVRAHLALGLARDPEPSAATLLVNAYRFEDDAATRRAIVRALSRRAEPQRLATLFTARDLDPDDEVRALAAAALAGRSLDPQPKAPSGVEPSPKVAWISIVANDANDANEKRAPGAAGAWLVRPDGLALPVMADPDGALIVPGLSTGPASLRVSPQRAAAR